ncbi:MAG: hypothetical protein ABJH07_12620 [Sedimentitalea sp.]|uniref:hypothetical protein n=1 Tax=Sedimentitalea sp. TaxID=2048915 RepID=UPI0032658777
MDDQTISIKSSHAFASFENFSDIAIEFPRPFEAVPMDAQFRVLARNQAYAVAAGETLLFDEFYMIPIDPDWAENLTLCQDVEYNTVSTFQELANCVPDLRSECFDSYLSGMNFWAGAGGQTPYRALAIRLTLGDNTYARAPLETVWYWRPLPDSSFDGSNCRNPDKAN